MLTSWPGIELNYQCKEIPWWGNEMFAQQAQRNYSRTTGTQDKWREVCDAFKDSCFTVDG